MRTAWERVKNWLKRAWGALVIAFLWFVGLEAQNATTDQLTWTAPTRRVDGTPLAPSEIREYRLTVANSTTGTQSPIATVAGNLTSTTVSRGTNPLGTRCYWIVVVDTQGLVSDPTGPACRTVLARPEPATNLTVTPGA